MDPHPYLYGSKANNTGIRFAVIYYSNINMLFLLLIIDKNQLRGKKMTGKTRGKKRKGLIKVNKTVFFEKTLQFMIYLV